MLESGYHFIRSLCSGLRVRGTAYVPDFVFFCIVYFAKFGYWIFSIRYWRLNFKAKKEITNIDSPISNIQCEANDQ